MGKLKIINTKLEGLHVIEPIVHEDNRGAFFRVFCEDELNELFKENNIKQVNHSITSKKGTVRGMHFQYHPDCEVKFVKCIKGKVLDVVVDLRKGSDTFLEHFSVELSSENRRMIYIPKGFAHGFQTLDDESELLYFHSSIYTPSNEGGLNIKDPLLNIKWPLDTIELSKRDEEHAFLTSDFKGIQI